MLKKSPRISISNQISCQIFKLYWKALGWASMILNFLITICGPLKVLNKHFSAPFMGGESLQCICGGSHGYFFDLSVDDGLHINLNHITFLILTVAHSSSLSTPLTHINTHIFACTHPSCCAPTERKYVGYKSKLYPVWVFCLRSVTIKQTWK